MFETFILSLIDSGALDVLSADSVLARLHR